MDFQNSTLPNKNSKSTSLQFTDIVYPDTLQLPSLMYLRTKSLNAQEHIVPYKCYVIDKLNPTIYSAKGNRDWQMSCWHIVSLCCWVYDAVHRLHWEAPWHELTNWFQSCLKMIRWFRGLNFLSPFNVACHRGIRKCTPNRRWGDKWVKINYSSGLYIFFLAYCIIFSLMGIIESQ